MANIASMKSHGIEFTLSTKNIVTKDFDWNSDFIFSNSKNEVTDLKSNAPSLTLLQVQDLPVRVIRYVDYSPFPSSD